MAKAGKKVKVETLEQVQNVSVTDSGENVDVRWDPVVGATKYSVRMLCSYDLDGDGLPDDEDEEHEVEEGSTATTVSVPKTRFLLAAVEGEPAVAPLRIEVSVKAMAPGRGGKKKGAWSAPAVWPA